MERSLTTKEIREIIKEFVKMSPKEEGRFNQGYKEYLAKCKLLYGIDKQLTSLESEEKDEFYEAMMKDVTRKVKKIVNGYIEI